MTEEKQQYPLLDCKKVIKIKTTSLKLFNQKKQHQDTYPNPHVLTYKNSLESNHKSKPSTGFQYLNGKSIPQIQTKSFQQLILESKKILQERQKIQQLPTKAKRTSRPSRQNKSKKNQKAEKRKRKQKQQKNSQIEEPIVLSPLDIEKYSLQNKDLKNLIQKIDFFSNISTKVNIIFPLLNTLQNAKNNEIKASQKLTESQKTKFQSKNRDEMNQSNTLSALLQLEEQKKLEIEINLLKKNLNCEPGSKQTLSAWQIQKLAEWEIESTQPNIPFEKFKYSKNNMQLIAQELENNLEQMEKILCNQLQ